MYVRNEDRLGVLEIEGAAEGDADGEQHDVIDVAAEHSAEPDGEGSVQREALGVMDDLGAEVSTEQHAGVAAAVEVRDTATKAEVVGAASISVEALERD